MPEDTDTVENVECVGEVVEDDSVIIECHVTQKSFKLMAQSKLFDQPSLFKQLNSAVHKSGARAPEVIESEFWLLEKSEGFFGLNKAFLFAVGHVGFQWSDEGSFLVGESLALDHRIVEVREVQALSCLAYPCLVSLKVFH